MKVGRLLLWTCTLLLTALVLVFGYLWYVKHRVESFQSLLATQNPQGLSKLLALVSVAPPMKCVEQSSTFDSALTVVAYFYNGKTRMDFIDPSKRTPTLHEVMDADNFYVWTDDSETILHLSAANNPLVPQGENGVAALHDNTTCEVWWSPDTAAFNLPGAKTITEG